MAPPLVAIVVLNYNGREHLEYCLPSIASTSYSNYRIIVVDNASTDGSDRMVTALCSNANLIRSETNRGWSGGNNIGIVRAMQLGAEYVVLANNDIRVDPRWLEIAVEVAERNNKIGVVGFHVLEPLPGSNDHDAGFEEAKVTWRSLELSCPRYVGGMAMLIRTELFKRIGVMDEGFFAYGEENDFQIRTRKAGYQIVATNVPIWHYGQGSFGKIPRKAALLQTRNNIRLLLKHSSFHEIVKSGFRHIVARCAPAKMTESTNPAERRLRPSNWVGNLVVVLYAVLWNLVRLPSIVKRRREDNSRAQLARRS